MNSRTLLKAGLCTVALAALTVGTTLTFAEPQGKPDAGDKPQKRMLEGPRADGEGRGRPEGRGFDGERPRGPQGPRIMEFLLKDLNLTEDQHEQIKVVLDDTRDAHMKWREEHADEADALRAEVRKAVEAKDREALAKLREKMKALREDAPKPEDAVAKIRPILTEEQATKFDAKLAELKEKMKERAGEMREGRGPRGPRPDGESMEGDRPQRPEGRNRRGGDRPADADKGDKLDI
jgi:Spy/CpxP family protein refolding chaperone